MKLTILGCSGSFPGPDSAASSYLVEAQDDERTWRVLLDLGSGALGALQRFADPLSVDAVVVSHLHPDHFMDLCGLYVARRYHPDHFDQALPALPVFGPQHTAQRLAQAYGPDAVDEMPKVFDVREMTDAQSFTVGPITVTPRRVDHPVPAFGLRLEHAGATLAYSGDTDSCPALVEVARDVDLLLCEASFLEGRDEARGIHLTGHRAGQAATEAGARSLVLTHIPVWTDAAAVQAEARATYAGPLHLARPGATYDLTGAQSDSDTS